MGTTTKGYKHFIAPLLFSVIFFMLGIEDVISENILFKILAFFTASLLFISGMTGMIDVAYGKFILNRKKIK